MKSNSRFGKAVVSESCMKGYGSPKNFDLNLGNETISAVQGERDEEDDEDDDNRRDFPRSRAFSRTARDEIEGLLRSLPKGEPLSVRIQATFDAIIGSSIMEKNVF